MNKENVVHTPSGIHSALKRRTSVICDNMDGIGENYAYKPGTENTKYPHLYLEATVIELTEAEK